MELKTGKTKSTFVGDGWLNGRKHKLGEITIIEQWSSASRDGRGIHYFDIKVGRQHLMYSDKIPMKVQANTKADKLPIQKSTYTLAGWGCLARFFVFENAVRAAKLFVK